MLSGGRARVDAAIEDATLSEPGQLTLGYIRRVGQELSRKRGADI